jgi:hypothetical protein
MPERPGQASLGLDAAFESSPKRGRGSLILQEQGREDEFLRVSRLPSTRASRNVSRETSSGPASLADAEACEYGTEDVFGADAAREAAESMGRAPKLLRAELCMGGIRRGEGSERGNGLLQSQAMTLARDQRGASRDGVSRGRSNDLDEL